MKSLNPIGLQFQRALDYAGAARAEQEKRVHAADKFHVAGVGATLTAAYEQLRNAAENAEESMLLTRAIRRFLKRSFLTLEQNQLGNLGEDLLVELTLAGYLENDSVPMAEIKTINRLIRDYTKARGKLAPEMSRKQLDKWTLDVMAVQIASTLHSVAATWAYADFAYNYYLATINPEKLFGERPASYEASLAVAVGRALLRYDAASSRFSLLLRYQIAPTNVTNFKTTNAQIDAVLDSKVTEKLTRIVDRHGAPFRIIERAMDEDDDFAAALGNPKAFAGAFDAATRASYMNVAKSVNRGIIRSVIFLIITKFLIGIAIEVPYDLIVHGVIRWLPLAVNLAFPPLYMILLRLTLYMPGANNSQALAAQAEHILYDARPAELQLKNRGSRSFGLGFQAAYVLIILAVFGGVGYLLWRIGFEWVHLLIFFMFISAASFLGFRLSRLIRELEIVGSAENGVTMVRDFLYMPFVAVGRWMSEKYAQYNFVSMLLDMLVELPLKTILRLLRQWGAFVSSKKDEL